MSDKDWQIKLSKTSPLYHQMRSPLRLHLLNIFAKEPARVFDATALSKKAGILVKDVIACLKPMVYENIIEEIPIPSTNGYRLKNAGEDGLIESIKEILDDNSQIVKKYSKVRNTHFAGMIGVDPKMKIVFEMIRTIARSDATVLIVGETGTGKELVAAATHELSPRVNKAFNALNCATLPETLFESEMFGYEKGAFTGANGQKAGRFEQAHKGTLFLDELGELSLANQVKLLRVLQAKSFERLGGSKTIKVDFRLIAATNKPLDEMINTGEFREDLYYRVNVFPIHIPSLRERKEDIPILATDFLQRHCQENFGDPFARHLEKSALLGLQEYSWPGNVRELENIITRLVFTAKSETITYDNVNNILQGFKKKATSTEMASLNLQEVEQNHIRKVLKICDWNIKKSAEVLGVSRVTLYKKIKNYGFSKS